LKEINEKRKKKERKKGIKKEERKVLYSEFQPLTEKCTQHRRFGMTVFNDFRRVVNRYHAMPN